MTNNISDIHAQKNGINLQYYTAIHKFLEMFIMLR